MYVWFGKNWKSRVLKYKNINTFLIFPAVFKEIQKLSKLLIVDPIKNYSNIKIKHSQVSKSSNQLSEKKTKISKPSIFKNKTSKTNPKDLLFPKKNLNTKI